MLQFKDVAHFYLGVKCETPEGVDILKAVYQEEPPVFYNTVNEFSYAQVKPVLKKLSDKALIKATIQHSITENYALVFVDLIKERYDLFGLIESGQAIEETL